MTISGDNQDLGHQNISVIAFLSFSGLAQRGQVLKSIRKKKYKEKENSVFPLVIHLQLKGKILAHIHASNSKLFCCLIKGQCGHKHKQFTLPIYNISAS